MPGSALDLTRPAGSSELEEKDLWHAPCQFRIQPYNAIELKVKPPGWKTRDLTKSSTARSTFGAPALSSRIRISTRVRRLACSGQPLTFTKTSSKCQRQVTVTNAPNVLP
jgi:hypothetical protein